MPLGKMPCQSEKGKTAWSCPELYGRRWGIPSIGGAVTTNMPIALDKEIYLPTKATAGMLGLARRAGKVCPGVSPTLSAVRSFTKPALVLVADEASNGTKSKLWGVCFAHGVPYITVKAEGLLGSAIGAKTEIYALGITDNGFAERIRLTCELSRPLDNNTVKEE